MNRHIKFAGAFLLLIVSAPTALAEIHRWVDENGQVHFEDRSKDQAERGFRGYTEPPASGVSPEQRRQKTQKLLNAYEVERQQAREQKAKQKKAEEERQRRCHVARDNLRRYQAYSRFYRLDREGNRVYMSEQEHAAAIQRSTEQVSRYCDG